MFRVWELRSKQSLGAEKPGLRLEKQGLEAEKPS